MGASPPYMLCTVEAVSGSCDQVILDIQQTERLYTQHE